MKKLLKIALILVAIGAVGMLGLTAVAWMGVQANDSELADIQASPDAFALDVSGMT